MTRRSRRSNPNKKSTRARSPSVRNRPTHPQRKFASPRSARILDVAVAGSGSTLRTVQAESHPTPAPLEAIGHRNRTSVIGTESLVALSVLIGAMTMRVNEVIRSVVTSKVTACAPSSIDDEKIEALPSTRIHSGPFRIEGMEESVTFLDDGLSLLINGQVFTLQEIYVAGLRYDTTAIRDVIGAQGITGITCDDATTFQAGVNSLKITRNNFATIARRLRDGHGGVTTERELPSKKRDVYADAATQRQRGHRPQHRKNTLTKKERNDTVASL
jgi:hypothetical protein